MLVIDRDRGHYQIDENNGIVIDMYYYSPGIVTQLFDVDNVRLIAHEAIDGDSIDLQIITAGLRPQTTSQAGTFVVNAYPFSNNQRCTLTRQR